MVKNPDFRLIHALHNQPVDRTPVWMMRQAGRYLPEYRKLRSSFKDFTQFYKNPEVACEATLQPIQRFPLLDALIVFSDILTVPEAMGMDLKFYENKGPVIHNPIKNEADIDALLMPDTYEKLGYVGDAIALIKDNINTKPLIGFSGSPWTLATYMIDGTSKGNFVRSREMAHARPELLNKLLKKLTHVIIDYLDMQVERGADVLMLFDSWGGLLSLDTYRLFCMTWMKKITNKLRLKYPNVPLIVFSKGVQSYYLPSIAHIGSHGIGLDWTIELDRARSLLPHPVCLQGNLDPAIMSTNPATVQRAAMKILNQNNKQTGYIFNLGHGIHPAASPDLVSHLLNVVASYSLRS